MSKVVETTQADLKVMLDGGVNPATVKKREKVLDQFKEFIKARGQSFEQLIEDAKSFVHGKTLLETTFVEYLAGLRILEKATKQMIRPKVSYLDLKRSFLKTELSKLTGIDFSSKTACPTLAAGTSGVKKQLKKEGKSISNEILIQEKLHF